MNGKAISAIFDIADDLLDDLPPRVQQAITTIATFGIAKAKSKLQEPVARVRRHYRRKHGVAGWRDVIEKEHGKRWKRKAPKIAQELGI